MLAVSAAPICSSFSRAITPAARSRQHLRGVPWVTGAMAEKLRQGNSHSDWLSRIIRICQSLNLIYWVENPDTSFLWLQSTWVRLGSMLTSCFFKVDFCRFGTSWRKRTRIYTNTKLAGVRKLCNRDHVHQVLRGRSKRHGKAWTKVAEPYPRGLCSVLAHAVCSQLSFGDPDDCGPAFCGHRRIGEAKNPGPRRKRPDAKDPEDLERVYLVRPETIALGKAQWDKFLVWLHASLDERALASLWTVPSLLGSMMAAYGKFWYGEGGALYAYRHLVVYAQRNFPLLKGNMQEAWNVISKWEEIEPVVHRKPVPYAMLQAMAVLAISWQWYRFAACLLACFHACTRPGEILMANRSHLVLPCDIGEAPGATCFLKICKPKPGRRGLGRVQHATIRCSMVSIFLERIYGGMKGHEALYPGSPAAFRTRWNLLLKTLGIPKMLEITPGSLRAGGTIHLYKQGFPIMDILWSLRLKNLETLQRYLQEISTEITMINLATTSRQMIFNLAAVYPKILSACRL